MLEIASITPINGSSNASLSQRVVITFTEPLVESSIIPAMINLISNDGYSVPVSYQTDSIKLTIIPQELLFISTTYTLYVSAEDFSSATKIESIYGYNLSEDIIISFSTQSSTAPGPDSPLSELQIDFTPEADIKSISPKSGLLITSTIIITLNAPITDTRNASNLVELYEEDLTGETTETVFTGSVAGSEICINITTPIAGNFYSLSLASDIETQYGLFTCENVYRFIKKPLFGMFPIAVIRYKLGGLAAYINDYDIYTAITDVAQNIQDQTGINILSEGIDSKLKQAVKDTVFFALIEKLAIEKFASGGSSIQVGNLSVTKSFPSTKLLEYYKQKAEEEVESAALSVQELRVAIRGRYVPRVYRRDWNRS